MGIRQEDHEVVGKASWRRRLDDWRVKEVPGWIEQPTQTTGKQAHDWAQGARAEDLLQGAAKGSGCQVVWTLIQWSSDLTRKGQAPVSRDHVGCSVCGRRTEKGEEWRQGVPR